MILPRRTPPEYLWLARPSAQRRDLSSARARATVFPFTLGTTQRTTAGGRGGGGGAGGGKSHGGVASVVAFQLTWPVEQPPDCKETVPAAPRSAENVPLKPPRLKLRLLIGSGEVGLKCAQVNPHDGVPGTSVIRKLITPVQPGVTVKQTDPRPPEWVPR
jgi:hypothetical protein